MSLVSDALRKARQEKAERSARERGVGVPLNQDHRRPGRFAVPVVIGMIFAVGAGVAGGVVAWWLLGSGEQEPPVVEAANITPTEGSVLEPVEPQEESKARLDGTEGRVPEVNPETSAAETESLASARQGAAMPGPGEADAGIEPASEMVQQPVVPRTEAAPRKEDSRDFVAEGRIGEVTLSLGYIVFRETDPFAEINGVTAFPGTVVSGFRVEEIHRDRVVLSNEDGPVVIRVR